MQLTDKTLINAQMNFKKIVHTHFVRRSKFYCCIALVFFRTLNQKKLGALARNPNTATFKDACDPPAGMSQR